MTRVLLLSVFAIALACTPKKSKALKEISLTAEQIPRKIYFKSKDGILISANLYHFSFKKPVILFCHQANYNKFEYDEIAKTIFERGFNGMSIDQRSGGSMGDSINETHNRAIRAGKSCEFLDAQQDIEAAINYLYKKYKKEIILWGSSYSATLALYQGLSNSKVKSVIAFSPGNYFAAEKGDLCEALSEFKKPLFITSSEEESKSIENLIKHIPRDSKPVHFIPIGFGQHGSKALWSTEPRSFEYWDAINLYLDNMN